MAEIKQISDNVWEIPRTGNMLVPGRILASEKLMKAIEKDKTIEQVKNVACLPGIIGYSLAMADAHLGYGFSIGGVAAFDIDKGVISPGGVGFDINCLKGDSKILSELGYWKKIKNLNKCDENLIVLDKEKREKVSSELSLFMSKIADNIIKITTTSGTEVHATPDHPFYTKDGMKELKYLKKDDEIILYPFNGVSYEEPEDKILISEEDIDKLNRSSTSKLQIKNGLKSLELLPLHTTNPKLPYIIRIMGFVFGDGNIKPSNKKTLTSFYGNKEDLESIKLDLEKLGFSGRIYSKIKNHKIKTQYKEYQFTRLEHFMHCGASSLGVLLNLLGTPTGNKSKQDYPVPEWIMNSKIWQKRLFLAALFGAELSSPKSMTHNKFNLYGLLFSMSKANPLYGMTFMNQISKLLEDFDIRNVFIKNRIDEANGTKSYRMRIMIYSDSKNLLKLFTKINYDYNIKKRKLANAAIVWLRLKEKTIEYRDETRAKAREMRKSGITKAEIISSLSSELINESFLEKSIYYPNYSKTGSRIAFSFAGFNEFLEKNCFGEQGFVIDKIENIEELAHNNFVYDLTIKNNNHNFIANGFVVSNCGVRLLKTNLNIKDAEKKKEIIVKALYDAVPSGVGERGRIKLSDEELDEVMKEGAQWAVKNRYGNDNDWKHIEDYGKLERANPGLVSQRARKRGKPQLGSLGAGNHFVELQYVDEVFDEKTAKAFGLEKGQVTIMIHCGSRGLGHQVASDYIQKMEKEYGWPEEDRQLTNAQIKSDLGKEYFSAMCAAANFAYANRQIITHWIREAMKKLFPKFEAEVVYDVCHNIAKFEKHEIEINGKAEEREVLIMRKGATRSFGEGRKELPESYKKTGQPVIIPGSMGTASYVLVGTKEAEKISWSSTAHGAGRLYSRSRAKRELRAEDIKKELNDKGIIIKAGSWKGIVEEAPQVYKDIEEVARVSDELGIGRKVARLKPMGVVKG
ncbi:RtcB family protein [Candidatus Pacearchaeota archaeon]|nr:RtcB family protein [Candidatus Pacearchaeota archaeon]